MGRRTRKKIRGGGMMQMQQPMQADDWLEVTGTVEDGNVKKVLGKYRKIAPREGKCCLIYSIWKKGDGKDTIYLYNMAIKAGMGGWTGVNHRKWTFCSGEDCPTKWEWNDDLNGWTNDSCKKPIAFGAKDLKEKTAGQVAPFPETPIDVTPWYMEGDKVVSLKVEPTIPEPDQCDYSTCKPTSEKGKQFIKMAELKKLQGATGPGMVGVQGAAPSVIPTTAPTPIGHMPGQAPMSHMPGQTPIGHMPGHAPMSHMPSIHQNHSRLQQIMGVLRQRGYMGGRRKTKKRRSKK